MAKRTKLGAAGAAVLHRRTGAEALAAATAPSQATPRPRPTPDGFTITTIRFADAQWHWIRRQALERAIERGGGKSDASAVVRDLVAEAMAKASDRRR
jgi:hypothetical protein